MTISITMNRLVVFILLYINCINATFDQTRKGSKENNANLEAKQALQMMEDNITTYATSAVEATWRFYIDATDENANSMVSAESEFGTVYYSWWENFLLDYDYGNVTDDQLLRQFEIQSVIGTSILNETLLLRLNTLIARMTKSYAGKVCKFEESCDGKQDEIYTIADVRHLLRTSEEYMEMAYYWAEWREETGAEIAHNYAEYVQLMNIAAQGNGFTHAGEMWLYPYLGDGHSVDDFWEMADHLFWNKTFPYYQKLHAYVAWRLESNDEFTNRINENDNLLPVNLLGSLSAEDWQSLYRQMMPYPSEDYTDITDTLLKLNSPRELFRLAEDFYLETGMEKMPVEYWKSSVFEESDNANTLCLPKTWDFYTSAREDKFRVSGCSQQTEDDLVKIHEDMSLTEYALAYKGQPLVFRRPVNTAISSGISGAIGLSVSTPQHLEKLEAALGNWTEQKDIEFNHYVALNYLFKQALKIIPNLSYMYLMEKWRWNVFKGDIGPSEYNYEWWKMRIHAQGLKPPFPRTPQDLDIAANENIGTNTPAFGLFLGKILQFQMYERLCQLAGHHHEKHFCDIYGSSLSGNILTEDILKNGASLPWQQQLQTFLGTQEITADPMINYFKPLFIYIDEIIDMHHIKVFWDGDESQVDNYIKEPNEISPAVPIIVGCVFAIMVIIVLVAFFIGRGKQNKQRRKTTANGAAKGNVQMNESIVEAPVTEGIVTHLDNDDLPTSRRKAAEEEIKNYLTKSNVETDINIVSSGNSAKISENGESSSSSSEASVKIKIGKDNVCFELSESDSSRL